MNMFIRGLLCVLLLSQSSSVSAASPQQDPAKKQDQLSMTFDPKTTLEDGTPVKLRISQTVSSADAHLNDRVEFEVLEDIRVGDALIIPKGGIAWGTVTEAQPKRRMGRGGKLEIIMDSVRLADGEKAALRATKEVQGGGHTGAMTAGIVATGLLFFPAAPFFLFMHGKDITVPKGAEVTAYINGDVRLETKNFHAGAEQGVQSATAPQSAAIPSEPAVASGAAAGVPAIGTIEVRSSPDGAEVYVDGAFIGNAPATLKLSPGQHTIRVTQSGFKEWSREIAVQAGSEAHLSATLDKIG